MLGSRQSIVHTEQIVLYIENQRLSKMQINKNVCMCVIIDKHLSWDKQIDDICLNITHRITLLRLKAPI